MGHAVSFKCIIRVISTQSFVNLLAQEVEKLNLETEKIEQKHDYEIKMIKLELIKKGLLLTLKLRRINLPKTRNLMLAIKLSRWVVKPTETKQLIELSVIISNNYY